MGSPERTREDWEQENRELRAQLAEAQETLRAIREGDVDALVVATPEGPRIFTLRSADQAYRTIIEQMQDGAVILVGDGRINYSNRRFAELVQRPLEQIIGAHIADYVVESERDLLQQLIRQAFGGDARGELVLRAGDGAPVPILVSLTKMVLDELSAVCMVITDLSERKRAEALLASEQFIRRLVDNVPIGVAVVGRDSRYLLANPAYQGIHDVAVLGRSIAEVSSPAVARFVQTVVEQVLDSGQTMEVREVDAPFHGRTWWNVTAIPLPAAAGATEAVLLLTQEVTEQKLAADALRESEQRFRLALHNSPVSVAAQDRQLVYQWAYNQRTRPPQDIIGKTDTDLFAPEDLPRILEVKRRVLQSGTESQLATWMTSNGRRVFLDVHYEPLRDSAGKITGIGMTAVNLTEQKLAEDALARAARQQALLVELAGRVVAQRNVQELLATVVEAARELTEARLSVCGHGYTGDTFRVGVTAHAPGVSSCPPGEVFQVQQGGVYLEVLRGGPSLRLSEAELSGHPAWCGVPAGHAPLRGLLGARLVDGQGQP